MAGPPGAVGGPRRGRRPGTLGYPVGADPTPSHPSQDTPARLTPLTTAGMGRVQGLVGVAVEAGQAAFTVDAGGVMLGGGGGPLSPGVPSSSTLAPPTPRVQLPPWSRAHLAGDAHAAALVGAVLVLAGIVPVHLRVVVAVVRVAVAVAGWREAQAPSCQQDPQATSHNPDHLRCGNHTHVHVHCQCVSLCEYSCEHACGGPHTSW